MYNRATTEQSFQGQGIMILPQFTHTLYNLLKDKGRDAMRNLLSQKGYQDVMCHGITILNSKLRVGGLKFVAHFPLYHSLTPLLPLYHSLTPLLPFFPSLPQVCYTPVPTALSITPSLPLSLSLPSIPPIIYCVSHYKGFQNAVSMTPR